MPDDVNEIGADERVVEIEMERLREFRNHPFKVKADPSVKSGIWEMDDPAHAQRGGGSQWRQLSEGRTNSV